MPAAPTIAIVGGGVHTPVLARQLAGRLAHERVELRLLARRPDRLAVIAEQTTRTVATPRPGWRVRPTLDPEVAFAGADVVVLLLRVGGLRARGWDESFPRRFGLAGDEGLGLGGVANAWRTLPVLGELAQAIATVAPTAKVLNLTSPLGVTTRGLLERGLDAVGLCELPAVTRACLPEPPADLRYGGLNHLGWFWSASGDARWLRQAMRDGLLDRGTAERFGALPLHYWFRVFAPDAARALGMRADPDRAHTLERLSERLLADFARRPGMPSDAERERAMPWFELALVPAIDAVLGGEPYRGHVDVRNDERLPELPAPVVVEVEAELRRDAVHATAPGTMPDAVAAFTQQVAHAEDLLYEATTRRDPDLLVDAILALPLPISSHAARELGTLARAPVPADDAPTARAEEVS